MTTRQHRTILSIGFLVGTFLMVLTLLSLGRLGEATAQTSSSPTPATIDPTEQPFEALGQAEKLYRAGAWASLGIIVVFYGLTIASRRIAWLQQGRRALWVSAALGGLALLVVPASQGTTPNATMIVIALGSALALAMNPKPPAIPEARVVKS